MNEGGLFGERMGWHLPGFDDSAWKSEGPVKMGLKKAGVHFYRTTFSLDIKEDLDVPLGIEISTARGTVARVQLFVNGYILISSSVYQLLLIWFAGIITANMSRT
jgi:hypothetical protein